MFRTSWLCCGRQNSAVEHRRSDNSELSAVLHRQTQLTQQITQGVLEMIRLDSNSAQTQQQQQLMQQQHVAELERTRAADREQLQDCAVCLGEQCVALLPCRHVCRNGRAREQQHSRCPVCREVVETSYEVEFTLIESVPEF
jgi:hypothetical protein